MSRNRPTFPPSTSLASPPKGEGGKGGEVQTKSENTSSVLVLNKLQYQKLVNELPPIFVGKETSELNAGYQLGIQLVLQKLRDGFVV